MHRRLICMSELSQSLSPENSTKQPVNKKQRRKQSPFSPVVKCLQCMMCLNNYRHQPRSNHQQVSRLDNLCQDQKCIPTTVLRPFFRHHPGEPVTEENFWTLWCKGRLTEADTATIQLGATPSGLTSAHLHHALR